MKLKLSIMVLGLLLISGCDTNSVSDTENGSENLSQEKAGWYMRTVAKATAGDGTVYFHKTAGVMGELKESEDGKDKHDINAFGSPALSVHFVQEAWGEDNGDYFSDYRAYSGKEEREVWTIQVRNNTASADLTNAPLKLTLEGPYTIYKEEDEGRIRYIEELSTDPGMKQRMTLIDLDHQKEYSYDALQNMRLAMDGLEVRTFRWVLGPVEPSDYTPLDRSTVKVANSSINNETETLLLGKKDTNDKFGTPPSF